MSGLSFSTWASRIPTIKTAFGFNEAELGSILLALPVGSLLGLPISGWLVSKYNSRVPLTVGYGLNAFALALIGIAHNTISLIAAVVIFAFTTRIFNISVNTQALTLQKRFDKKIMGSFHGYWSMGGIGGILLSTLLLELNVSIQHHFTVVAIVMLMVTLYSYQFLLKGDRSETGNKLILSKPDPYIFYLGSVVFLCAICEGGMFDWSGIYFQDIVKVEIFTYGYLIFMTFMATSRFLSDLIVARFGMPKTYIHECYLYGHGHQSGGYISVFLDGYDRFFTGRLRNCCYYPDVVRAGRCIEKIFSRNGHFCHRYLFHNRNAAWPTANWLPGTCL